jgi:hypothetical protein
MKIYPFLAVIGIVAALVLPLSVQAGPGHDHGPAAPAATGPALPRLAAESELFELVGVLEGRRLTLYLDRSDDNAPVLGAQIELEIAGAKFVAQKHSEEAEAYEIVLPADPKPELLPVTATITAGTDLDLLAGELDLQAHADDAEHTHAHSWKEIGLWAVGAAAGLAVLIVIGRRLAAARQRRAGAAA